MMDMSAVGCSEADGADWWQQQEGLERVEREAWEAEQAARGLLESVERINPAGAAVASELCAAVVALRAALVRLPACLA